jgi:hypothetical protein
METTNRPSTTVKSRNESKHPVEMIIERMEGGILVQRYKNKLIDPEKR